MRKDVEIKIIETSYSAFTEIFFFSSYYKFFPQLLLKLIFIKISCFSFYQNFLFQFILKLLASVFTKAYCMLFWRANIYQPFHLHKRLYDPIFVYILTLKIWTPLFLFIFHWFILKHFVFILDQLCFYVFIIFRKICFSYSLLIFFLSYLSDICNSIRVSSIFGLSRPSCWLFSTNYN